MSDQQGLIQVEAYEDHVFTIVKTLRESDGVQYILTYQKFYPGSIMNIQASFEDIGDMALRTFIVFGLCRGQKLVGTEKDLFEGWSRDPYDETIKKGVLMNLS